MSSNPTHEMAKGEECAVCMEEVSRTEIRMTCCGKQMHRVCRDNIWKSNMTAKLKNTCIMCRQPHLRRGSKATIKRLRNWVKKGKQWAQEMLGTCYRDGNGVPVNLKRAKELYELAVQGEGGCATAMNILAHMYQDGKGVEQSNKKAKELYERAVQLGELQAQFNLAEIYYFGDFGEMSFEKAAELYAMSAVQGEVQSQYKLGFMYMHGQGVNRSFVTAREWLNKSVAQGHASAINTLKQLDEIEECFASSTATLDPNDELHCAAVVGAMFKHGDDASQLMLGLMYIEKKHDEQSLSKARFWLGKAAAQGNKSAIKALKKLNDTDPNNIVHCVECNALQTDTHKLKRCGCKSVYYCSSTCQKSHWNDHKREHRRIVQERTATTSTVNSGERKKQEEVQEQLEEEQLEEEPTAQQKNKEEEEERDDCPVCLETLPKRCMKYLRLTCCGKGIHRHCAAGIFDSNMTDAQKNSCTLCRTKSTHPGTKEDIKRIRHWVDKGKAWAQHMLASRYQRGQGVAQSWEKATELNIMAADQGHASSTTKVALMYYYGRGGLEKSKEREREWMMKAATLGDQDSIMNLRFMDKEKGGRTTPSFKSRPIDCWNCGKEHSPPSFKLIRCNGCQCAYYCNRECQKNDWKHGLPKTHKEYCKLLQ